MSGGGGGNTTTNTIADPWSGVKPYLQSAYNRAAQLYENPSQYPQYFPYSTVAPQSDLTTGAIDYAQGLAPTYDALNQNLTNAFQFSTQDMLNPESNQYLQQYAQGAVRPIYNELLTRVIPSISDEAIQAGGYGGTRQNLATARAVDLANQSAGDITSKIYSDAYSSALDNYTKTLLGAPSVYGALTQPFNLLTQAGGIEQQQSQQEINDLFNRYNYNETIDYNMLRDYLSLLQGTPWGQSTTMPGPQTSPVQGALGGASLGYAGASALGASNPYGWAILGALAGLGLS